MRENNTDLRLLALETLLEIERTGGKAGEIIRAVLEKYRFLPKNQRAFYARLTEGVIENRICLDYVIGCYSRTPVNKIKPVLRNILRMAVYQIREMDAVPDAAAVLPSEQRSRCWGRMRYPSCRQDVCRRSDSISRSSASRITRSFRHSPEPRPC